MNLQHTLYLKYQYCSYDNQAIEFVACKLKKVLNRNTRRVLHLRAYAFCEDRCKTKATV